MRKNLYQKIIAVGVCFSFIFSYPIPVYSQGLTPSPLMPESKTLALSSEMKIPEEMGKITESYQGTQDRLVILIQDAHEIPDAQRNIEKLIEYAGTEYGIQNVALEGAAHKLDTTLLGSFPDPKRLREVIEEYYDRGEITGGTAAAIFGEVESSKLEGGRERPNQHLNPSNFQPLASNYVRFQGIEDWTLYEEGLALYQKAMEKEPDLIESLRAKSQELRAEKEKAYTKEQLEIDEVIEKFYEDEIGLPELVKQLVKCDKPEQGSELAILADEILRSESQNDGSERELREAVKCLRSGLKEPRLQKELNAREQEYLTSQLSAEAFGSYLKKQAEDYRIQISLSEKLLRGVLHHERLRDLEGTTLMEELEKYLDDVQRTAYGVVREEQKTDSAVRSTLYERTKELRLLKKLAKLELSRKEWEAVKKLDVGGWKLDERPEIAFQTLLTSNFQLRTLLDLQLAFYRNSEQREAAFIKNIKELLGLSSLLFDGKTLELRAKNQEPRAAVMVAGGFHTDGLKEAFQQEGISYVVVRPAMKEIPDQTNYREHMKGNVSWAKYFEVEEGRINLYKAFTRATRDTLIGRGFETRSRINADPHHSAYSSAYDPLLAKRWRDQLLRDLAGRNELAKAGRYTRFLDELLPDHQNTTVLPYEAVLARVQNFTAGLRRLASTRQLTEQNILNLLKFSHIPSGMVSPAVQVSEEGLVWREGVDRGFGFLRREVREDVSEDVLIHSSEGGHEQIWLKRNGIVEVILPVRDREFGMHSRAWTALTEAYKKYLQDHSVPFVNVSVMANKLDRTGGLAYDAWVKFEPNNIVSLLTGIAGMPWEKIILRIQPREGFQDSAKEVAKAILHAALEHWKGLDSDSYITDEAFGSSLDLEESKEGPPEKGYSGQATAKDAVVTGTIATLSIKPDYEYFYDRTDKTPETLEAKAVEWFDLVNQQWEAVIQSKKEKITKADMTQENIKQALKDFESETEILKAKLKKLQYDLSAERQVHPRVLFENGMNALWGEIQKDKSKHYHFDDLVMKDLYAAGTRAAFQVSDFSKKQATKKDLSHLCQIAEKVIQQKLNEVEKQMRPYQALIVNPEFPMVDNKNSQIHAIAKALMTDWEMHMTGRMTQEDRDMLVAMVEAMKRFVNDLTSKDRIRFSEGLMVWQTTLSDLLKKTERLASEIAELKSDENPQMTLLDILLKHYAGYEWTIWSKGKIKNQSESSSKLIQSSSDFKQLLYLTMAEIDSKLDATKDKVFQMNQGRHVENEGTPLVWVIDQEEPNIDILKAVLEEFGGRIKAIVAAQGSLNSHWVVYVKGLERGPVVLILDPSDREAFMQENPKPGDVVELSLRGLSKDGPNTVFLNPSSDTMDHLREQAQNDRLFQAALEDRARQKTGTPDVAFKTNMSVGLNGTETHAEVSKIQNAGIGLGRTESFGEEISTWIKLLIQMSSDLEEEEHDPNNSRIREIYRSNQIVLFDLFKAQYKAVLADFRNAGKEVTLRTMDIQPDKNPDIVSLIMGKTEKGSSYRYDDQKPGVGFDFYRNVKGGNMILETQIAAMIAARHELEKGKNGQMQRPRLKIMVPMIDESADLDLTAGYVEQASRYAQEQQEKSSSVSQSEDAAKGDPFQEGIRYGFMVETPKAVRNIQSLLTTKPELFTFVSIGSNDLDEELINEYLTNLLGVDIHITRDYPLASMIMRKLSPEIIEAIKEVAFAVKKFNQENPKHPKNVSICGDLAGEPKFMMLAEYLRRKETPIDLSVVLESLPAQRHILRYLEDETQYPDHIFQKLFEQPDILTDEKAAKIVAAMIQRQKPFLVALERWNKRYREQGRELAFQKQLLHVESDMGGLKEFAFLNEILNAVEAFRGKSPKDTPRAINEMLETLRSKGVLFDWEVEALRQAYLGLSDIQHVCRKRKNKDAPLRREDVQEVMDWLKENRPNSPVLIMKPGQSDLINNFYDHYHTWTQTTCDLVTKSVYELCQDAFPPLLGKEERIEDSLFVTRTRRGFRFSRSVGFFEQMINQICLPLNWKWQKFEKNPILHILNAFSLAADNEAVLDHDVHKLIRRFHDALTRRNFIDLPESDQDRVYQAWWTLLQKDKDVTYSDRRMHQYDLLTILIPGYDEAQTSFKDEFARFTSTMEFLYLREIVERFTFHEEQAFKSVKNIFLEVRAQPEWIQTLRFALLLEALIPNHDEVFDRTWTLYDHIWDKLSAMRFSKQSGAIKKQMTERLNWLLTHFRSSRNNDLLTERETIVFLDSLADFPKEMNETDQAQMVKLLYLMLAGHRLTNLSPEVSSVLIYESDLSFLEQLRHMYCVMLKRIAPGFSEKTSGILIEEEMKMAALEADKALQIKVSGIRGNLLQHDQWKHYLESLVRTAGIQKADASKLENSIRSIFEDDIQFKKLADKEQKFLSEVDVNLLQEEIVERHFVAMAVISYFQQQNQEIILPLVFPVPETSDGYSIHFFTNAADPGRMNVVLTGLLFSFGFNIFSASMGGIDNGIQFYRFAGRVPDGTRLQVALPERLQRFLKGNCWNFYALEPFFDEAHPHEIRRSSGMSYDREPEVAINAQPVAVNESGHSLVVRVPDRRGIWYAVLRFLYEKYGVVVTDARFLTGLNDFTKIQCVIVKKNGQMFTPNELDAVSKGLEDMLSAPVVTPANFGQSQERSEVRDLTEADKYLLDRLVSVLGLSPGDKTLIDWQDLAKGIEVRVRESGIDVFCTELESRIWAGFEKSEAERNPGLVSREQAEAAVQYFLRDVLVKHLRHAGIVGFDETVQDRETLARALTSVSEAVSIQTSFFPKSLRGIEQSLPGGLNIQFRNDPAGFFSGERNRTFPVVSENARVSKLSREAFSVGREAHEVNDEPNLLLVEKVVQMVSGLLAADRVQAVDQLNEPDIQAALLKDMFHTFSERENLMVFGYQGFQINRALLAKFITEYLGSIRAQVSA